MIQYQCGKCGAQMESPDVMKGKVEVCPECGTLNRVPSASRFGEIFSCARCEEDFSRKDKMKLYHGELVCEKCGVFLEDIEKVVLPEATEDDFDNEKAEPSGIGGWLIIPAIGLILAPIKAAVTLFLGIITIQNFTPELTGDPRLWLIGLIDAALIIACIVVAVLFFRERRIAVPAFIGLMATVVIAAAVQVALGISLFGEADADAGKAILGPCVYAAIWIPYFLLSKRVKNTFTE